MYLPLIDQINNWIYNSNTKSGSNTELEKEAYYLLQIVKQRIEALKQDDEKAGIGTNRSGNFMNIPVEIYKG